MVILTCVGQRRTMKPAKPFANIEEANNYLAQQEKEKLFSGTALIVKKGTVIFREAYGLANIAEHIPNNTETKINIGSLNKTFTGVSVMQLVEKGKLSLEDKIVDYIPELKMEMADQITIRHLLQNKSGLGTYFQEKGYVENLQKLRNMEDYVPIIAPLKLAFAPGTGRQYSNAGYELLGVLVQRISDLNYYDYVKKHIYKKAKMENTDAYERDKRTENLAQGYTRHNEGEWPAPDAQVSNISTNKFIQNVNERHAVKGTAAGGGFSTIDDLYAFVKALSENKLLSEKNTDLVFNRFEKKEARTMTYRVGGGSIGINAMILADFSQDYVVVVLANYDPPTASNLAHRLEKTLLE